MLNAYDAHIIDITARQIPEALAAHRIILET